MKSVMSTKRPKGRSAKDLCEQKPLEIAKPQTPAELTKVKEPPKKKRKRVETSKQKNLLYQQEAFADFLKQQP